MQKVVDTLNEICANSNKPRGGALAVVRPPNAQEPAASGLFYWRFVDKEEARAKYLWQQFNALRRNIEWQFTFESWLEFWGDDLDRRGVGTGKLSMQRTWDKGPYSPENCYKDTPRRNVKTWQNVKLARLSGEKAKAHQRNLDRLAVSLADPDTISEDDEVLAHLGARISGIWEATP